MGNGAVEITVRDSMKFLIAISDFNTILKGDSVKEQWALVKKLATVDEIVWLFDKLDDGELSAYCYCFNMQLLTICVSHACYTTTDSIDKSTWGDVD